MYIIYPAGEDLKEEVTRVALGPTPERAIQSWFSEGWELPVAFDVRKIDMESKVTLAPRLTVHTYEITEA